MVEMALVAIFLMFLLFGIVMFGFLMSFRQNLTQAAAEGARAGAVAPFDAGFAGAIAAADAGVRNAVDQFLNGGCDHANMECGPPVVEPCDANTGQCVTVTIRFNDVLGPGGLLPNVPLVGQFMPESVQAKASAAVYTE
ncbi:MAG: TadE/TadG family type IV pilus assembly protein [Acidimicrobiia bacterium]